MPAKAYVDAVHVTGAAAHGLDYLLTWNCSHIANATIRGKIELTGRSIDFEPAIEEIHAAREEMSRDTHWSELGYAAGGLQGDR